jgi:thioesterase domain-containing protein
VPPRRPFARRSFFPRKSCWRRRAQTIARNYRNGRTAPIILVGHSLGANAAFQIAKRLQTKRIPVAYLATFDPTRRFTVPSNVQSFANFYQNNGHGRTALFPDDRREDKVNINLTSSPGMTHTNMDQNRRLQNIVIARILSLAAR